MADDFLLLGPEGDRLDANAALHGVVASLALSIQRRRAAGNQNRRVARQARALIALATALARAFHQPDDDVEAIVASMARADALGRRGLPHHQLITMPQDWPLHGLPITPPALALAAVMRLRQGLQDRLMATESARRTMQLRIVRDLELKVRAINRDLERRAVSPAAALRRLRAEFAAAEPLIGADLAELLGGNEAIAGAVAAAIGTDARPAA